jgi:hypothetical protein
LGIATVKKSGRLVFVSRDLFEGIKCTKAFLLRSDRLTGFHLLFLIWWNFGTHLFRRLHRHLAAGRALKAAMLE